jgi:putative hemolysin
MFKDLMKPALFVPENNSAYQVLEKFKESQQHSAFIVDEYGTILGMITLNDILEAIVGDIPQPDLQDYSIKKREDGSYLIDGRSLFMIFFLISIKQTGWVKVNTSLIPWLALFFMNWNAFPKREIRWNGVGSTLRSSTWMVTASIRS